MEATLTCAVCLSLFEEPVTLPVCSHNFCRSCLVACLGQAQRTVEPPPPPSYSRQQRPPARERPRPLEAEQGSAADPSPEDSIFVPCPLCREVCALPGQQGVAALPVNTTLAEVVKLFKASRGAKPSEETTREEQQQPWMSAPEVASRLAVQDAPCGKHPDKPLQLFCRVCCRLACGQCVSEEHQGVFHSVNLIGAAYQEQKVSARERRASPSRQLHHR